MKTQRTIKIDLSEPYEAAAALIATVCWPDMLDDDAAMTKRHACVCQEFLTYKAIADDAWALTYQRLKPLYLMQPWTLVERVDRERTHRFGNRLAAGRMMLGFLAKAAGLPVKLPKGVKRLSVNQLAELVIGDTGETDPQNIKSRTWMKSRPVIHIAAALVSIAHLVELRGVRAEYFHLFQSPDLIKAVVDESNAYLDIIPSIEGPRIAPEGLVRLQLA